MAYKANKAKVDKEHDDFQTQMDADTLSRHAEITSDPERHQKAVDHLGKSAKTATDNHAAARKTFEKKTKGRLKKVFGPKQGADFEQEKQKDTDQDEAIVKTKE